MEAVSPFQNVARDHPAWRLDDCRLPLSLRNEESLLHERGIDVSHESVPISANAKLAEDCFNHQGNFNRRDRFESMRDAGLR